MLKRAIICTAFVCLLAPVTDASSRTPGSIARFREVQLSSSSLGDFAGATSTWRTELLLDRSDKTVGVGTFVCIRVRYGALLRACRATYRLPLGQVELSGLLTGRSRYSLVITGGSGFYTGKNGTAAFAQIGSHPWTAFVTFYFT